MKYVSLHHHSTYSYMDGFGLPETHVERAADLGMGAIALTEHGNVSSHVKLEQAATKHGVKAIFGIEAYMGPDNMRDIKRTAKWHMTILAMNEEGYQTLNRLVTRSWRDGFYQWPTITWSMLRDDNAGLIVLSGCSDSYINCQLMGGKGRERGSERDAHRAIERFKRLLGDRFYLEVQQFPELGRTVQINTWLEGASRRHNVPLVATSDCHYPFPDDNKLQTILHAAGRGTGTVDAAEASWEYNIRLTLPTSDRAIYDRLRGTGLSRSAAEQAIINTALVSDRCNVTLPKMERVKYPVEKDPFYKPGMDAYDLIKARLNHGWYYRNHHTLPKQLRKEYRDRIHYELPMMHDKEFDDYFLMLSEAITWCKEEQIPVGPARGSAAASLVCFDLRITEIDPMPFPMMLFERFIDPNRFDLPDVDLDFDSDQRIRLREHLVDFYGAEHVGNIGTFTKFKGKNSIDDLARVFEIPKPVAEEAKSFLVERSGGDSRFDASIEDTVEMFPQVKEIFNNYPNLNYAKRLEGNYKSMGVHAAGLVVGAEPLTDVLATYTRTVKNNILQVMSVDKYDGEYLGLLKIDALGLVTMSMIDEAIKILGMKLEELYDIPLDDPKTLRAFEIADVVGIFQFEGRTTRMVCQEVAPTTFLELCDINALSRPGPLHSGSTGDYIAAKHGRKAVEHLHPMVDELTYYTQYQIIYQEQILALCRKMGQFPWVHAAEIRKVISQKKGEAAFNRLQGQFMEGAQAQGVPAMTAMNTWKRLVTAGTYAFNAAHCVSYSTLAFWMQWLKQHHPEAFYAATLAKTDPNKEDKMLALMRDASDPRYGRDISINPPHLNSGRNWTVRRDDDGAIVKGAVYAGFQQIKGIGDKNAIKIMQTRDSMPGGKFESWDQLQLTPGIGPKKMEFIRDFADTKDPFGIDKLRKARDEVIEFIKQYNLQQESPLDRLPLPTAVADDIPYEAVKSEHVVLGVFKERNLQDLYENHRSRTGDELDPGSVKDPELKDSMTVYCEDTAGTMTVKVNRWKYPELKEELWGVTLKQDFVLMVVTKKPYYGKTVHMQKMWVFTP